MATSFADQVNTLLQQVPPALGKVRIARQDHGLLYLVFSRISSMKLDEQASSTLWH